jgi:HK97 family phage major capsid protein
MSDSSKLPTTRAFDLRAAGADRAAAFTRQANGDLVVDMAFASDVPYERWWGVEILDCSKGAVRAQRLEDGAPLLFNHDWDDIRGTHVPGSLRFDDDGRVRGQVRISGATQAGRDAVALVEGGVLTKASVGYRIHKVIEVSTKKSADGEAVTTEREIDGALFERLVKAHAVQHTRDGVGVAGDLQAFRRALDEAAGPFDRASDDEPTIFRVVDWEPYENSLVTIPADNGVGVGRSLETRAAAAPEPTNPTVAAPAAPASQPAALPAAPKEGVRMDTNQVAGEPTRLDPLEVEKQRRTAIGNLCKANNIDSRVEDQWVRDGTRLEEISGKILDIIEERGKARPTAASDLGLSRAETQRFSLFSALRYLRRPTPENSAAAAYELDCSRTLAKRLGREDSGNIFVPGEVLQRPLGEAAQRAMATQPGSKGGYLVDTTNMGFIDILRNRSVAMSMGARRLPGLVGNVSLARQTGKGSVTWQGGDGTSVTATDQTLGQLSMTPKTAIAITDVSEQLMRQSTPAAEGFVMADLAADIAIDGVDYSVINGTGGAQPLGIKNTTGITSAQDASSATYAKMLAFPAVAGGLNAIKGNPGWVTNVAGASVLMQKQRFSSTDTPLWEGNLLDGSLCGFRAMSSEQLASGNIIFGSWDEVVIGEWGVLELATDTGGTRFNAAQVGIRAMWMVDVLVRYPQAFVVSTSLSA